MAKTPEIVDTGFRVTYTWESIYWRWSLTLERFNVDLNNIFEEVRVFDPEARGGEPRYAWWPTKHIQEMRKRLNDHFARWPGTLGPLNHWEDRKGPADTLILLTQVQNNPEGVCALFLLASLFARIHSSRGRYVHENWPHAELVRELDAMAASKWEQIVGMPFPRWHYTCTDVIPIHYEDLQYTIKSIGGLIRYLGEEHAALLCSVKPVRVVYADSRRPVLADTSREQPS